MDPGDSGQFGEERGERLRDKRPTYSRANYLWSHATGPFYGSVDKSPASRNTPGLFHTPVGTFDLKSGALGLPDELRKSNRLSEISAQYFVVLLDPAAIPDGALSELRDAIEGNDGAIVRFAPVAAAIARLTPGAMAEVQKVRGLLAVEPYHPAFKLHPTIGRVPLLDPMKAVSEVYDLDVRVFKGEDAAVVAAYLAKLGGNVTAVFADTVRVEIHRSKLARVAAVEAVEMVFEHMPVVPLDEETTTTIQTGSYNQGAMPYHDAGIDGSGGGIDGTAGGGFAAQPQVLMTLDSGIQLDAADLAHSRFTAGTAGPGHRKVRLYQTTIPFGGDGDLLGCDAPASDGVTHGHAVAAVALGRASKVDPAVYGDPFYAWDEWGRPWSLDGVASGAVLVTYDAQRTPAATSCDDPMVDTLTPGDLYSGSTTGSLGDAYTNHQARVFNFAWGAPLNYYGDRSLDVDDFLYDKRDAMILIAAGNSGDDGEGSLSSPAGSKNALAIGSSGATIDLAGEDAEENRPWFSSMGPGPGGRVAPQLMAPGWDYWSGMGLYSGFSCRSRDNDQLDPVECDVAQNLWGTSYSTAGAAGAALLVRDYFAQGFYPDGTSANLGNAADQVADLSGAMIKALLIASADFMDGTGRVRNRFDDQPLWPGLDGKYRFNNEQGYGRIKLDNVLPLQNWPAGTTGLVIVDGGIVDIAGLDGTIDTTTGEIDTGTFDVCDSGSELRVALAWTEASGEMLINDLDLELVAPSGTIYFGNYFTDDDNRNGTLEVTAEDCPSFDGVRGRPDESPWSLPACQRNDGSISPRDRANPTEAIMLSPDPFGNGTAGQTQTGTWTVNVLGASGVETAQRYALVVSGGVCTGSGVRLDSPTYTCNGRASITVSEKSEVGDVDPTTQQITVRTVVQVLDGTTVVDEEDGLGFSRVTPAGLEFVSEEVYLTDGTAPDSGNGVLDVRSGNTIRVLYADVGTDGIIPDPDRLRASTANVDCTTRIAAGNIVFPQYGRDTPYLVTGGCERSARGNFAYGYPDRYMDAGETVSFAFGFASNEYQDLENVSVALRCVLPDADSPADCSPGTTACADPNRQNNPSCDQNPSGVAGDVRYMTILDTPKVIALMAARAASSIDFTIRMEELIPGTPAVELLASFAAPESGKTAESLAVVRLTLDADEVSLFYSTDFPLGGTQHVDFNNNEIIEDPISEPHATIVGTNPYPALDYVFETRIWSDLTAGGTKNTGLMSPWNFDVNDGGFRSGLLGITDEGSITNTIAQWGEDKNFNNVDDKRCTDDIGKSCTRDVDCLAGTCESAEQRDPADNALDKNWSIRGGCGWQTKPIGTCAAAASQGCYDDGDCPPGDTCTGPSSTGGIWHTGRIGGTTGNCLVTGNNPGQCQAYETIGGSGDGLMWAEALMTPVMEKVNGDDHEVQILGWGANLALDLADEFAWFLAEFDNDVLSRDPVDLYNDRFFQEAWNGPDGAVSSGGRWGEVFAPLDAAGMSSANGTLGGNREAKNCCFFEGGAVDPGFPSVDWAPWPPDDDIDNDGDGLIDEFVTARGPWRNWGFGDHRYWTFEDDLGETGSYFQGAITLLNLQADGPDSAPALGYGIGVDDVVVEWREFTLVEDVTDCVTGECAVVNLQQARVFEGNGVLTVTVIEHTPDAVNDCDLDCFVPADYRCEGERNYCAGGTRDGLSCTDVAGDSDCPGDLTADPPVGEGDCLDFSGRCVPDCAEGGPTGPRDCDDDGRPDVVVKLTSITDVRGEIVFANATGEPGVFRGEVPTSTAYESEGVLFVGAGGEGRITIDADYHDRDDGTGQICRGSHQPNQFGVVEASTILSLLTGDLRVTGMSLDDNGDQDGFADTHETVAMRIRVSNPADVDLSGVTARLATDDPKIDCILDTVVFIGDVPARGEVFSQDTFVFRVADVDRTQLGLGDLDDFSATFDLLFSADQFDSLSVSRSVTLDLDLDAVGGSGPTIFFEGFESGTFGSFEGVNMDQSLGSLTASHGYRCQYSDPSWHAAQSYGVITDCFLTANQAHADAFYWQVHTPSAIDGGKAYSGNNSLYMGIFGQAIDDHTTPLAVLEAMKLAEPIYLGASGASSELSIKQQVSFVDERTVNTTTCEYEPLKCIGGVWGSAVGRGVVQLQLADGWGNPVGPWLKIDPYFNVYDQQDHAQYWNCTFDPIDDGNTEHDFFQPNDPDRRYGPSSTCLPEYAFVNLGDTFSTYSDANLGNAEGPGLRGTLGTGTWVESRFNLDQFRGRRVRLRFLNTDIKIGGNESYEQLFRHNPDPGDDGWWIDDVTVTNTLIEPATMTNDDKDNSQLPGCGNTCNLVSASLIADPPSLPAPGQVVELSARDAVADRCLDGVLQFRYWIDTDDDGAGGGPEDVLMRSWTDVPETIHAPRESTSYVVDVRCSSDHSCADSAAVTLSVDCPSSGTLGGFPGIVAPTKNAMTWDAALAYDFSMGSLADLNAYARLGEGQDLGPAGTFDISGDLPVAGQGIWYLFRQPGALGGATGYCNAPGNTWGNPARDVALP